MVPDAFSVKINASHELTHLVNGGKEDGETRPPSQTVEFIPGIP